MRILFDQGTPVPLRRILTGHEVVTAFELNWQQLQNGRLLAAAEAAGFAVLITTDRQLRYQQNLAGRQIAIIVLPTTSWPRIRQNADAIVSGVADATPGAYIEVVFATG